MDSESFPRAEEMLKLLASAVVTARLYPAASQLPHEAMQAFTQRANDLATLQGPLRFVVDPHAFRLGDAQIASSSNPVVTFAETLHALQVGQFVIAPGVTEAETETFIRLTNSDPTELRAAGGVRAALVRAGVTHLAVIEVTLRASDESGLAGLDLTSAPLSEIAVEVAAAAKRRAEAAATGAASDEMADAIGKLEEATRELAMERVAAAMMQLDEATRMAVMSSSLAADAEGTRMEGMLAVVARMKPAALARLLKLVAAQGQTDPRRIAGAMSLPPETMKMLAMLLTPTPAIEPDFGVPDTEQAASIVAEVTSVSDTSELDRQVAIAHPQLSSGRALATATSISRRRLDAESIRAIADVMPQAARDGAFPTVREALRLLDEIANDPALTDVVAAARASLADPAVLYDVCRAPQTDADAAIAGEILHAAGTAGAEAMLDCYIHLNEPNRSLLRPVLRGMSESILGVARHHLRTNDHATSVAIVNTLPALGDRRAVPVIAEAVDHLDEQVRFAALTSLASIPTPEAAAELIRGIKHREPETQRFAVREIGRGQVVAAVPALSRALEDINVFQRTYETRKEIIGALFRIATPDAEKALRGFGARTLGLGRRSRELRALAKSAADQIASSRGVNQP